MHVNTSTHDYRPGSQSAAVFIMIRTDSCNTVFLLVLKQEDASTKRNGLQSQLCSPPVPSLGVIPAADRSGQD